MAVPSFTVKIPGQELNVQSNHQDTWIFGYDTIFQFPNIYCLIMCLESQRRDDAHGPPVTSSVLLGREAYPKCSLTHHLNHDRGLELSLLCLLPNLAILGRYR